ncbi:uncharacterized protein LOC135137411 [Zophobas morio]|uniref:uncharacterized protein LOC135137411 n=1 Tax=Zophobas morio TaxID=2755281 RepID=UPI00308294BB
MATKSDNDEKRKKLFKPETYKKRSGTNDSGKEFEYMMCALYALKLTLNKNVSDFKMTANNDEYGAFDDISLKITFTNGESKLFLLQLKHKESKDRNINSTNLASLNQDFSLIKYISSFEKLNVQSTTCILYTNCGSGTNKKSIKGQNFKIPLKPQAPPKQNFQQDVKIDYEPDFINLLVKRSADTDISINIQKKKRRVSSVQKDDKYHESNFMRIVVDKNKLPDDGNLTINITTTKNKNAKERVSANVGVEEEASSDNDVIVCVKKQAKKSTAQTKTETDEKQDRYLDVTVREGKLSDPENEIINTNQDKEGNSSSVFQFEILGDNGILKKLEDFSKNFYLLVNQQNVDTVKGTLKEMLLKELNQDIYNSFVCFINNWWSRRFVLTKHTVICKLVELSLSPWCQKISSSKINQKGNLLTKVIMEFEMTIVKNVQNDIVQDIWDTSCEDREDFNRAKQFLMGGLELTPEQEDKVWWYLNKVPLIVAMHDHNKDQIKRAITLFELDTYGTEKKKIVFLGNVKKDDFPQWNVFDNLCDIKNENVYQQIISTFYVSLQGRQEINLEKLEIKDVEVNELLEMTQKQFLSVDEQDRKLPVSYISRTLTSVFLDTNKMIEYLASTEDCIIIINCDERLQTSFDIKNTSVIEFSQFFENYDVSSTENTVLLCTNRKCSYSDFDDVYKKVTNCEKSFHIYLLQTVDNGFCTILNKRGHKLPIDDLKIEYSVTENVFFRYFNNHLNVFCAPPGMGKSTLLVYLSRCCPSDFWCLLVRLIDFNPFLRSKPDNKEMLRCFMHGKSSTNETFDSHLKNAFLKTKKIYVLLDGLDEVDSAQFDLVVNFSKWILTQGGYIWISCRENLRDKVTSSLHAVTVDINELTFEEQQQYVKNRLDKTFEDEELQRIINVVFASSKIMIKNQQLLAIPLQLYIITEILCTDARVYESINEKNFFVLTKLYKIFFEGKKSFLHEKIGIAHQDEHIGYRFEHHLKLYEIPALRTVLDENDYQKLDINDNETQRYLEDLKRVGEKFGIINHVSEDNRVIFNHQTYAEYFACAWFLQNLNKLRLLQDVIFLDKYANLRMMFDILMAEECPLHLAVIYGNVNQVQEYVKDSELEDAAGRKALHLVCTYGAKYHQIDRKLDNFTFDDYRLHRESSTYMRILEILLRYCQNISKSDGLFNFTCFDYSSASGCLYPFETLIYNGLLTFQQLEESLYRNFDPVTVVFYAAQMGYRNLLYELTLQNPDLVKSDKFAHISLLRVAVIGCKNDVCTVERKGNVEVVDILLQKSENVNAEDTYKRSILDYACQYGCYDMLSKLLEYGAKCTGGNDTVHVMAKYGTLNEETVKLHSDLNAANREGTTALQLACENGHTEVVKTLLQKQSSANTTNKEEMNALHFATKSKKDNTEVIKLLLTHKVDINAKNMDGSTPLHLVCSRGHLQAAKILIQNSADINAVDKKSKNALHYAAVSKDDNSAIIELLVHMGLDSSNKDDNGMTPLHIACCQWQARNVQVLLKSSNVNSADNNGMTALHHAVKTWNNNIEVIALLTSNDNINVNAQDHLGKTPLHLACEENQVDNVRILLDKDANVNILSKENMNALHYASNSWKEKVEIVNLLIDRHIDVNAKTISGTTALFLAYDRGNINIVRVLLKKCPNIDLIDQRKMNILHHATKSTIDDDEILCLCKEKGIDVNAQTEKGKTALHFACKQGKIETIKTLKTLGADVNMRDNEGRNALHHAILSTYENPTLITLLKSYDIDLDARNTKGVTPLHLACAENKVEMAKTLLDLGADANTVDNLKQNSLHYAAAAKQSTDTMNLLLDSGANANAQDAKGTTPLSIVCKKGQLPNVEILLLRKVDVNLIDREGFSALHQATQFWKDNTEIISLLLDNGINVNATNNKGRNALQLSCKENHICDVKTLLQRGANLHSVDKQGMSALHYAASSEEDSVEIINLLVTNGLSTNQRNMYGETPLHLACKSGNVKNLKELCKNGRNLNEITSSGKTVLHYAAESKNVEMLKYVLSFESDINASDNLDVSVLHVACQHGSYDCVKLLIDHNADVHAVTNTKKTVLHYAVLSKETAEIGEIINSLLNAGVDVETKDLKHRNAIVYAVQKKRYQVIKIFIQLNKFSLVFEHDTEDFLYYTIYSGCLYGLDLFNTHDGILETINTNNKEFPLDFLVTDGHLKMDTLIKMTKFVNKVIEFSSYSVDYDQKYSPGGIAAYLRHLLSQSYHLETIFSEIDSSSSWNKRFSKLQKFLGTYKQQ